jgi:hypothetical protein
LIIIIRFMAVVWVSYHREGAEPTFLITEKKQKLRFLSPARTDGTEVRHHSLQRVKRQRIYMCVKSFLAQAPAVMDNTCGRPNGDGPGACSTVLPVVDNHGHGPGACSTVTMLPAVDEHGHGPGARRPVTMLPWVDEHGQVWYGPSPPCPVNDREGRPVWLSPSSGQVRRGRLTHSLDSLDSEAYKGADSDVVVYASYDVASLSYDEDDDEFQQPAELYT